MGFIYPESNNKITIPLKNEACNKELFWESERWNYGKRLTKPLF